MNVYISRVLILCLLSLTVPPYSHAQQISLPDAGELQVALHKLNVLGSGLYVAAHPDDENTAALAYFSKGRKYRTAYLSLTRGDGGQNLIGPEKGAEIGIIRTQELLAARRIDGAEQYFTRAIDFGYSKTPEETLEFWGQRQILSDIVWVIRSFRPDVIISRFAMDGSSGHGHHTASGWLVKEAFRAAADPQVFPEQLKHVSPWQAKRLYWNSWRPSQKEMGKLQSIDIGQYNPLLGKSYTELSAESRSFHKSQGFGATSRRGPRLDHFALISGDPATEDLFDGIDTTWSRVSGAQKIGPLLRDIARTYDPLNPSASLSSLLDLYKELSLLENTGWVDLKRAELRRVIQAAAGLWMESIADDYAAAPGDAVQITTTLVNRSGFPFKLQKVSLPVLAAVSDIDQSLQENVPFSIQNKGNIPPDFPVSQPYWLKEPSEKGIFVVPEQLQIGASENPPSLSVQVRLRAGDQLLEYTVPVLFRWTDRVEGELYRSFEVRPRVTIHIENKVSVFPDGGSKRIPVTIKSHSPRASGRVRLMGGENWSVTPESIPFTFSSKYAEQQIFFEVTPPASPDVKTLTALVETADARLTQDLVEISYPHIHRRTYFPESRVKVVKLVIQRVGSRLGYVMGAGDEVAEVLRTLGYEVIELSDQMLENADFSGFDAIITGMRAYNTREKLKIAQPRLLEYVENGGTLVVQYNVSRGLLLENLGPYPLSLSSERVSMETAPVVFLDADHPLLNFPNRITQKDFQGWVQERGLYFATRWDEKYVPVLVSHDTNEPERKGGLLFTRYGKGAYVYTGFSWFRQLPAGVPGALRLFANLIAAGKDHETLTR